MPNLQPKDIIALLTVVSMILARIAGIASEMDAIVALILGYYFAKRKTDTPTQPY